MQGLSGAGRPMSGTCLDSERDTTVREGDAGVSDRHALVLVNHGHASGTELWALAERVRAGVLGRFGVELEAEPLVV